MAKVVARSYFDVIGQSNDGLSCDDPSLTVQSSKDECDINFIVNRYMRTGVLPQVHQAIYADLSELGDLRDMMHMVNDAQQAFMELPAETRRFFDNDPAKLVEFASDPRNMDKAVELGLAVRRPVSAPSTAGNSPAGTPSASVPNQSGTQQPAAAGPNSTTT